MTLPFYDVTFNTVSCAAKAFGAMIDPNKALASPGFRYSGIPEPEQGRGYV
jgi:hypothetical protein